VGIRGEEVRSSLEISSTTTPDDGKRYVHLLEEKNGTQGERRK